MVMLDFLNLRLDPHVSAKRAGQEKGLRRERRVCSEHKLLTNKVFPDLSAAFHGRSGGRALLLSTASAPVLMGSTSTYTESPFRLYEV